MRFNKKEGFNNFNVGKHFYFKRLDKMLFINIFITVIFVAVGITLSFVFDDHFLSAVLGVVPLFVPIALEMATVLGPRKLFNYSLGKNGWQAYVLMPLLIVILPIVLKFIIHNPSTSGLGIIVSLFPITLISWSIWIYVRYNKKFIVGFKEYKDDVKTMHLIDKKEVEEKYYSNSDFESAREELSKDYEIYLAEQEEIRKQEYEELHRVDAALEHEGKSVFDGNIWQFIGWKLLGRLLTAITLGICYPVAVNMINHWEVKHTVINGRRLSFDGTALQLFGKWILWWLLSIITLGIYALFVPIKIKSWEVKHSNMIGGKEGVESKFDGKAIQYVGMKLLTGIIKFFTLGILTPVAEAMMMNWEVKHTTYNGYHLYFDGNGFALSGKYILWYLLGIVTLGIFYLIIPIRLTKWKTKHMCLFALKDEIEKE